MRNNKIQGLKDNWIILHDPDDIGKNQKWFEGIPEENARPAEVPGFSCQFYPFEFGIFWYQTKFVFSPLVNENEIVEVRIGAANFRCETYLNGNYVGEHCGTEDPFSFDITKFLKTDGENVITFRVSKPYYKDIDGYNFWQIPHRNERIGVITPGSCQNECGFSGPVEIAVVPKIRITDLYLNAMIDTKTIKASYTIESAYENACKVTLKTDAAIKRTGEAVSGTKHEIDIMPGENIFEADITLDSITLWSIDNPFLYNVVSELICEEKGTRHILIKHVGFRDFRVKEDGFFYLNGKRLFLKCTHTGNAYPGSTKEVSLDPAFVRKDLFMAKASGMNAVRFIAGAASPDQLDYCDELGLMVYQEWSSSWLQCDGPRSKEFYQHNVLAIVKRDRSHPSVCIWGMLNETLSTPPYGDCCKWGYESLPELRKFDKSRLVLYSSGRFDGNAAHGSVCNPYSEKWEHLWNEENENNPTNPDQVPTIGGYFQHTGDFHYYPKNPITKDVKNRLRTLGAKPKRPVFCSEYGCGSILDVYWLCNKFDQDDFNKNYPDVRQIYRMRDSLDADLKRYGFENEFFFKTEIMDASYRQHNRQRELIFDMLRSNPYVNGYSITGMLDHSICGEGLWTLTREYKPGIMDVLQDGFANLRWCVLPEDTHIYSGSELRIEAWLANEDVLKERDYPVSMKVVGNGKTYFEKNAVFRPTADQLKLLSIPVFDEKVRLNVPTGEYEILTNIEGAAATCGKIKINVTKPKTLNAGKDIVCAFLPDNAVKLLEGNGFNVIGLDDIEEGKTYTVIAGDPGEPKRKDECEKLFDLVRKGSKVVFICRYAFVGDYEWNKYIFMNDRPVNYPSNMESTDWLYHKEYFLKKGHPYFKNLPTGMMDWEYWDQVVNGAYFYGGKIPDDTAAICFCTGATNDGCYEGGFNIGKYNLEKGSFVLISFNLVGNIGVCPAADQLLINIAEAETK